MNSNSGISYDDLLSNIDKDTNEKLFQEAYDKWDTDQMWFCVFRCNNNIVKSLYKKRNIIIDNEELLEIVTDATAYIMKFILQRNVRPQKLSSYNYLRCLRFITDPRRVFREQNIVQFPQDKDGKEIEYGE